MPFVCVCVCKLLNVTLKERDHQVSETFWSCSVLHVVYSLTPKTPL